MSSTANVWQPICDTPLFTYNISVIPYFTPCFENTILFVVPVIFIAIGGLFQLVSTAFITEQPHKKPRKLSRIQGTRFVLNAALISFECAFLGYAWTEVPNWIVMTMLMVNVTSFCISFGIDYHHSRNEKQPCRTSECISIFWLIVVVTRFPTGYRYLLASLYPDYVEFPGSTIEIIRWTCEFIICLILLLLSTYTDEANNEKRPDPEKSSTIFSRYIVSYYTNIMCNGFSKPVTEDELFPSPYDATMSASVKKWNSVNIQSLPLKLSIYAWKDLTLCLIGEVISSIGVFGGFFLLDYFILCFDQSKPSWHAYISAVLLFISMVISTSATRIACHKANLTALKLRSIVTYNVYMKTLRTKDRISSATVINLISVDAERIMNAMFFVGVASFGSILHQVCSVALLVNYLGIATLAAAGFFLATIPALFLISRFCIKFQMRSLNLKSNRLNKISEALCAIKLIKLFAWEPQFLDKIMIFRHKEGAELIRHGFYTSVLKMFWSVTPFAMGLAAFVTYLILHDRTHVPPNVAFVSLAILANLKPHFVGFPNFVTNTLDAYVALQRIQKFLESPELDLACIGRNPRRGISVSWVKSSLKFHDSKPFLQDTSLQVQDGEFLAIVGRVGSGKSALLKSLLGDLTLITGSVDIRDSIAYVPQEPWIQNATVLENILFTKEFASSRCYEVTQKCCLEEDLKIFPGGLHTEIGENGINISGGQKQRISVGRAVYQDKAVYLLDDPLSAVDSHVAKLLFTDVFCGMLKNKTRLLVTNVLAVLPKVDRIVVLENGKIVQIGTYEQISNHGALAALLEDYNICSQRHDYILKQKEKPCSNIMNKCTLGKNLIIKEIVYEGNMKLKIYSSYLSNFGLPLLIAVVVSFAIASACDMQAGLWLSDWTNGKDEYSRTTRIVVYTAFGILYGLFTFCGVFGLVNGSVRAARLFHKSMLNSIFRAPLSFFDTTPMGRLLNRFGRDIDQLDSRLPYNASATLECVSAIIATYVVISIKLPIYLLVCIPWLILMVLIQRFHIRTSRQLSRMDSISRSPIAHLMSETVTGISSIRSYAVQDIFSEKARKLIDRTQLFGYHSFVCNTWLRARTELLGNMMTLLCMTAIVYYRDAIQPGLAGFLVSYAWYSASQTAYVVKNVSQLESAVVSSERVEEYTRVKSEADWVTNNRPLKTWPQHGEIIFEDFSARYRSDLDLVLKNINIKIEPGKKFAIVGRTGSGKSSLALCLFRIMESVSGRIIIDGIDVSKIGLHDLRSKLTIIPQEPLLFNGTLRQNLDPNHVHNDDQIISALENATLKNVFELGLDTMIAESGSNLSFGQRQLVCLARAMLDKNKILVLDEATASVDAKTDALIQNTIRKNFMNCTIVTIAHRIHTIMDYDQVVVISDGTAVEQGNPEELSKDMRTHFYLLAKEALAV